MKLLSAAVFIHVLTAVHAVGAVACFVMAAGSASSDRFTQGLAVSGGSERMVGLFGAYTWVFLLVVGVVLLVLAVGSWRRRPWAWHLTLVVYGIGVVGSLWQVSVGIREGWTAAAVNAAVVVVAAMPAVRQGYRRGPQHR